MWMNLSTDNYSTLVSFPLIVWTILNLGRWLTWLQDLEMGFSHIPIMKLGRNTEKHTNLTLDMPEEYMEKNWVKCDVQLWQMVWWIGEEGPYAIF